jgi:hypothetical protein
MLTAIAICVLLVPGHRLHAEGRMMTFQSLGPPKQNRFGQKLDIIRILTLSSLLLACTPLANAKSTGWVAVKLDAGASAANCKECDENISALITCEKGSPERELSLQALEQREDKLAGKPAVVSAKSESGTIALSGIFTQPGEAGPYPVIKLSKDDPAFEFLSHASSIEFSVNGTSQSVAMTGSRAAIAKMNEICR